MLPATAGGIEYALGPDSLPQEGVPTGTVEKRTWDDSRIYPGTTHEYWIYVPAQYTDAEPAAVMAFQDGLFYVEAEGLVRAPTVFDNLIHRGEMPVTIGVFINPGMKEIPWDQRSNQYTPLDDTYARFLLEEILPEVGRDYNLTDEAAGRAIAGMSDGGLASFTVAWQRPDAFSKVVSHVGSYTRLQGGSRYPYLIRKTRGNPKPIRVFLQDGENDINLAEGNWALANLQMDSALMFARYDYRFEMGTGGHDLRHGGAIFPDTLRWLWRDYPGVVGAGERADPDAVVGEWDVLTKVLGEFRRSVLAVSAQDGALAATLHDEVDGEMEVTAIRFEDGILSYEYVASGSQSNWGKGSVGKLSAWLQVRRDTFRGALSLDVAPEGDFAVEGRRRTADP
ncbi:MAG: alpha/beta hydrolase-fold protein [Acidobacteria bacterium]|nr:alpha/beta hydrolase-fold protein [Acidobacteriota bacterium]